MYFDVGLVLLACTLFVLFRWKMCNILIPCKCSTGRLAHYRTFFMFYELENTIMIRKCATLCTRKKTYTNVFSMYHFMFNVKVRYFWAAMICKLFSLSFVLQLLLWMLLVGVSEIVLLLLCMELLNMLTHTTGCCSEKFFLDFPNESLNGIRSNGWGSNEFEIINGSMKLDIKSYLNIQMPTKIRI